MRSALLAACSVMAYGIRKTLHSPMSKGSACFLPVANVANGTGEVASARVGKILRSRATLVAIRTVGCVIFYKYHGYHDVLCD